MALQKTSRRPSNIYTSQRVLRKLWGRRSLTYPIDITGNYKLTKEQIDVDMFPGSAGIDNGLDVASGCGVHKGLGKTNQSG